MSLSESPDEKRVTENENLQAGDFDGASAESAPSIQEPSLKCPSCGTNNDQGMSYCGKCGCSLHEQSPADTAAAGTEAKQSEQNEEPPKSGGKKKLVIIIIAAIAVAACIAFTAAYVNVIEPSLEYQKAASLYSEENYAEAAKLYEKLGSYQDSEKKLSDTNHQLMLQTYSDVYESLSKQCWYYAGSSSNSLYRLSFNGGTATDEFVYYDGNGLHEGSSPATSSVTIDDSNIIIAPSKSDNASVFKKSKNERVIPYTYKDGVVELDSSEYVSPAQVERDLQGNWTVSSYNFAVISCHSEYNISFHDGSWDAESATKSRYGQYYYGPYNGTYTIGFGTIDLVESGETEKSKSSQLAYYYFLISDGKAVPTHFDSQMKPGDGLKGEDGYSL